MLWWHVAQMDDEVWLENVWWLLIEGLNDCSFCAQPVDEDGAFERYSEEYNIIRFIYTSFGDAFDIDQ